MVFPVTSPVSPSRQSLSVSRSVRSVFTFGMRQADCFERSVPAVRPDFHPLQKDLTDGIHFGGKKLKWTLIGLSGLVLVPAVGSAIALVPIGGRDHRNAVTVDQALTGACVYGEELRDQDIYKNGVFAPYTPEMQQNIVRHALRGVKNATFLTMPAAQENFKITVGYVPPRQEGMPVVLFRPGADQRVDDDRPLLLDFINKGYGVLTYVDPVQNEQGEKVYQKHSPEEAFTNNFLRVAHWLASPSSIPVTYISGPQVQPVSISNQIWGGRSIGGAVVVSAAAKLEQMHALQKPKGIFMINTPANLGAFAQGWTDNETMGWFHWVLHQVCDGNISDSIEMLGHDFNVEATLPLIKSIPMVLIRGAGEHSGTGDTVQFVHNNHLPVKVYTLPGGTHNDATNSYTKYATRGENLAPDVDGKDNPNAKQVAEWVMEIWIENSVR